MFVKYTFYRKVSENKVEARTPNIIIKKCGSRKKAPKYDL